MTLRPIRFVAILAISAVIAYTLAALIASYWPMPYSAIIAFIELTSIVLVMWAAFDRWAWRR